MKFGTYKIIIIVLGLLVSVSAYAQEVRNITLDESIKIGLENSHQLHSSAQGVISSRARLSEVNANRWFSLGVTGSYTRLSEVPSAVVGPIPIIIPGVGTGQFGPFTFSQTLENAYDVKLTLQQPLFTGFRLSSSSDIAEYNYKATQEDYNADKNTLVYNIKNAYWSLFKANEVKKVVDENVQQVKAHLDDVQNLFKQGLATKNDLLRVQVQQSEAQLRQIDANNGVRLATINLNNVINLPLSTQLKIQEEVQPQNDVIRNMDELTDLTYKNRPELKAMDLRVKASESGITLAKSSWWPQLLLQGNYDYARPNQRIFPTEDKFKGTWDVSVVLQMNLWNWGQTIDQTTQAESQYEQAKDAYQTLRDGVTLELTQNYLNVLRARDRISVAEGTVSQAEENYRVTSEKYKNGLVLNTDLIDAEVDLLQARTDRVQALVDYEIAKANLEKSIGE